MPECVTWQNILLYKTVSCNVAPKIVLLHFKTLDFWIKTIKIMWTFTFDWKMKYFLYRGMRHVAGKGLQRTWEVKVIVTGGCLGIFYFGEKTKLVYYTFTFCPAFGHRDRCFCRNILLWRKDETCVNTFTFCLAFGHRDRCLWRNILLWKKTKLVYYTFTFCLAFRWVAWMSLLLSAVSHAGSLSGSRADLLSVASWQTSDKDGGEISHVCHRSDGVISSNLAQSDVAEKIYQLGFVYMCFLHFFSRGLLFILRASVGLSVVVPKPFCSWKIQTHATWGTRPSIFDRRKNIQTHRNFQS